MINEVTALVGYLGGIALGWGLRGFAEKKTREKNKNKKKSKAWLE